MPTYKGKYYKFDVVKANNDYECAVSTTHINKGEYYIRLEVENGPLVMNKYTTYRITTPIRVSKVAFANLSTDDLLDATGKFETASERVVQLQRENDFLRKAYSVLKSTNADLTETAERLVEVNESLVETLLAREKQSPSRILRRNSK